MLSSTRSGLVAEKEGMIYDLGTSIPVKLQWREYKTMEDSKRKV